MTQSGAREKIQQLIEKFRREQAAGVIGQYNEYETKSPCQKEKGGNLSCQEMAAMELFLVSGKLAINLKFGIFLLWEWQWVLFSH